MIIIDMIALVLAATTTFHFKIIVFVDIVMIIKIRLVVIATDILADVAHTNILYANIMESHFFDDPHVTGDVVR